MQKYEKNGIFRRKLLHLFDTDLLMENNDLAIIIPHLGQDALYRVLSSLTLQSDKRFVVYGFYRRGEEDVKTLFEDYTEHLDLVPCEAESYPDPDAPIEELVAFFLQFLAGERLVTFSDGASLYDRHCVRLLHAQEAVMPDCDLFRWEKKGGRIPFRSYLRDSVLGEKDFPLSELVMRRRPFEMRVSESGYFSLRQVLADLAAADGVTTIKAPVSHSGEPVGGAQDPLKLAEERCSIVEWAEERFAGEWPLGRWTSLMKSADLFTNLIPWVPKEQARERFMALRIAREAPGMARLAFTVNSWGL